MKPYKIFNNEILDKGKGSVNRTFIRFIGTADSIFSLLLRAYGDRHSSDLTKMDYEFVIIDKNLKHIEMCKEILSWDGYINVPTDGRPTSRDDFDMFASILINAGKKHDVSIGDFLTKKDINTTLGKITRYQFNNFFEAWNLFRKSKFTFMNIDVINDNGRFCHELMYLKDVERINNKQSIQFVKLDFNKLNYDPVLYKESIDNILHILWLKSFKEYQSIIELADDNNVSYEDYAGKIYVKSNPTFCILPWMHVQYKPTGQSKPCCRYDNVKENQDHEDRRNNIDSYENNLSELFIDRAKDLVIQKSTIEETFNSEYWNRARQLTLENKPISGCHKCYSEEQVDGEIAISMRLGSSVLYNNGYLHKKPKFEKPSLEFLEIGFGNYCNLACLSCNSSLSTTWHDDEVAFNKIAGPDIKRMVFPKLDNIQFELQEETLESLKLIKFTGGEPMINPEFVKFINVICEQGHPENISLEIYTNCSYIPSPKLLENLAKFKHIQLNLSIDAYGVTNDYVRYGSSWEGENKQTVSRAIDFWLEQGVKNKNINIIMSTTLSILNAYHIPKLIDWWIDKFKKSGNKITISKSDAMSRGEYEGIFKLQMAFDPSYIGMNILPRNYYKDIIDWIIDYENNFIKSYPEFSNIPESIGASLNKLKNTINRCKGDPKNARILLEYLSKMDTIRNNSAEESIPAVVNNVKEYLLTLDKPQQN